MNQNLKHHVWKLIKENQLQKSYFLVALSGGLDSMVLLHILKECLPKGHLFAAYIHHGDEGSGKTSYRDEALVFIRKKCRELEIPFTYLKIRPKNQSEAELRELRYRAFAQVMDRKKLEVLALGHHQEDLLETRLIRMIRGVSKEGLVAMRVFSKPLFRPFLKVSKKDLKKFMENLESAKGQSSPPYLEDPSNQEDDYLRNWLRNTWLPELEKKRKGSLKSLARSLEALSQDKSDLFDESMNLLQKSQTFLKSRGISRPFYISLNAEEKISVLAQYMISEKKHVFSLAQLEEIKKNLDKSQKELKFRVASCNWICNAERIFIDQK